MKIRPKVQNQTCPASSGRSAAVGGRRWRVIDSQWVRGAEGAGTADEGAVGGGRGPPMRTHTQGSPQGSPQGSLGNLEILGIFSDCLWYLWLFRQMLRFLFDHRYRRNEII